MESKPASDLSQWTSPQSAEALELTVYFDPLRDGGRSSLYDTLEAEYVDRRLRVSHRLQAVESLGRCGHVRHATSVDFEPPQVVVAVDADGDISSALRAVWTLAGGALVTLAPTGIVSGTTDVLHRLGSEPAKLVVHCRRGHKRTDAHGVGGVLEELHRNGIDGATAIGGGEGTIAGHRHRSRLVGAPPDGPMMVASIDCASAFARAAPALLAQPQVELITAKPIYPCKWHGCRRPSPVASADQPAWSQITLYTANAPFRRREHLALVRRLRELGAPGCTVLCGSIGYAFDPRRPNPEWFEHRAAPTVTTIVDTPDHTARWLQAIDDVTADRGLVTHEFVSAYRPM
jgi:PII-like signaling protein